MADYCTLAEVKTALGISDTTFDNHIKVLITTVSRAVDKHTLRTDNAYAVPSDTTEYFTGSGGNFQSIKELGLATTATSIQVAEGGVVDDDSGTGGTYTAWVANDIMAWPFNYNLTTPNIPIQGFFIAPASSKPRWYPKMRAVKITGKFGVSLTPDANINSATIAQVVKWYRRIESAFTDADKSNQIGAMALDIIDDTGAIATLAPYIRIMK